MKAYIGESGALCVEAEDGTDSAALKYWIKEYNEHGSKMLSIETKVKERKEEMESHRMHGNPKSY